MKLFRVAVMAAAVIWGAATQASVVRDVESVNIPSPAKVTVAVPECYDTDTTVRYPVVYMLNGHGGDHTTWGRLVDLDSLATAYGCLIVCPAGLNSWYWDSPVDSTLQMESYIIEELLPWVDANYRTRTDRMGRAVTGLSMGGHGGLWLGLRHTELFGSAGSTSGGVDIRPFPGKWNMADRLGPLKGNESVWDSHTVMELLPDVKPGVTNIIFDCGTEDFFYEVNNRLHRELTGRGIAHIYLTSPGAHNGQYWSRSIIPQLQFFHTVFYIPGDAGSN